MSEWIDWLYDIFVSIVTFVFSLFGFDLEKRSVPMAPVAPSVSSVLEKDPVAELAVLAGLEPVAEAPSEAEALP